jgi:hypothetical protein
MKLWLLCPSHRHIKINAGADETTADTWNPRMVSDCSDVFNFNSFLGLYALKGMRTVVPHQWGLNSLNEIELLTAIHYIPAHKDTIPNNERIGGSPDALFAILNAACLLLRSLLGCRLCFVVVNNNLFPVIGQIYERPRRCWMIQELALSYSLYTIASAWKTETNMEDGWN